MARTTTPETVKTAEKTLAVVEALRRVDGAGVSEIADLTGMSKSNSYKYLKTLEETEYVVKDASEYRLGLRFLGLGEYARSNVDLFAIAVPEVRKLAEETREMANLMVEEHGLGVFVYRADSERAVNLDTHAGKRVPLHTTAMGKAILANLPEERVDGIIDRHGLPRVTERTITDRETLDRELEDIREQGYADDDGERLEGLRCLAVPIRNQDCEVLGAISVAGPSSRLSVEDRDEILGYLRHHQNIIELDAGFY